MSEKTKNLGGEGVKPVEDLPNYRRRLIRWLMEHLPEQRDERLAALIRLFGRPLCEKSAMSFLLPADGELVAFNTPCALSYEDLHLPADLCILEYPVKPKEVKDGTYLPEATVVIVQRVPQMEAIMMSCAWLFNLEGVSGWTPHPMSLVFGKGSSLSVDPDGFVRAAGHQYAIAHPDLKDTFDMASESKTMADEIRVLAHFAMLSGVQHVRPVKIHEVDAKRQRTATSGGQVPLYDYWALDIGHVQTASTIQ